MAALVVIVAGAAGCGSGSPAAAPTPEPAPTEAAAAATGYEPGHSRAVREYYGDARHPPEGAAEFGGETEEEYRRPPRPASGGIGDAITLTGTNLGVRMRVTVTGVADPVRSRTRPAGAGRRYVGVKLRMRNTGVAIFESELREATLGERAGPRSRAVVGVRSSCSRGFEGPLRIDVGGSARGCVLFALPAGRRAEVLHLALEQVPAAAGGRWSLR
jgi:hypothetical protein